MSPAAPKERLDVLLVRLGLCPTRQIAQSRIMRGDVRVDGKTCVKPGAQTRPDAELSLAGPASPFVGRGGEKLAGALDALGLNVAGRDALDVGASTGGFTDCLLQRGTLSVTALDVGRAQLHPSLHDDPRVTSLEQCNFRHMSPADFPRRYGIVTIDVSFISLSLILPVAVKLIAPRGQVLALVKPQFEVGKGKVGKGGVVRDSSLHAEVLRDAARYGMEAGLHPAAVTISPLKGPKGNSEFFMLYNSEPPALAADALEAAICAAVSAASGEAGPKA